MRLSRYAILLNFIYYFITFCYASLIHDDKTLEMVSLRTHLMADFPDSDRDLIIKSISNTSLVDKLYVYSVNSMSCRDYRHYLYDQPIWASKNYEQQIYYRSRQAAKIWQQIYHNAVLLEDFVGKDTKEIYMNLWGLQAKKDCFTNMRHGYVGNTFKVETVSDTPFGVAYPEQSKVIYVIRNTELGQQLDVMVHANKAVPVFIFDVLAKPDNFLCYGDETARYLQISSEKCSCGSWLAYKQITYTKLMLDMLVAHEPNLFYNPQPTDKFLFFLRDRLFIDTITQEPFFIQKELESSWSFYDSLQILKDLWPDSRITMLGLGVLNSKNNRLLKTLKRQVVMHLPRKLHFHILVKDKEDRLTKSKSTKGLTDYDHHILIYSQIDSARIESEERMLKNHDSTSNRSQKTETFIARHFAFNTGDCESTRPRWQITVHYLETVLGTRTVLFFHLLIRLFDDQNRIHSLLKNVLRCILCKSRKKIALTYGFIPKDNFIFIDTVTLEPQMALDDYILSNGIVYKMINKGAQNN